MDGLTMRTLPALSAPLPHARDPRVTFQANFLRPARSWLRDPGLWMTLAAGTLLAHGAVTLVLVGWLGVALASVPSSDRAGREAARSIRAEMAELSAQASEQRARLDRLLAARRVRLPVAAKLAGLVKTLPARTWITRVTTRRAERSMVIEAVYVLERNSANVLPVRAWQRALEQDPQFGPGLKRLELGQAQTGHRGTELVYEFSFVAEWN